MINKVFAFLVFVLLIISCKKSVEAKKEFIPITTVKSYTYDQLKPLLKKQDNKTYVVNFWATWCAPCVEELPAFEKLKQQYADKNVEVLLVSLDFPNQVESRLIPFINSKKLESKVILLNDPREDYWIEAIDKNWSGALPATLIYNNKNRKFYEQSFDFETLKNELQTFI